MKILPVRVDLFHAVGQTWGK